MQLVALYTKGLDIMNWAAMKILGIVIASVGGISAFSDLQGTINGSNDGLTKSTLIIVFIGCIVYYIGNYKAPEFDIKNFFLEKGYPNDEADERTKLAIQILKERGVWPNVGISDLESAARAVNSFLKKER